MSRAATGTVFEEKGVFIARVTIGKGQRRPRVPLPAAITKADAEVRALVLARCARRLHDAGKAEFLAQLFSDVGQGPAEELTAIEDLIERICQGDARPIATLAASAATIDDVAKRWLSGELAREYPSHIREKRSVGSDKSRYTKWIKPKVGNVLVSSFTSDDAERVLAQKVGGQARHIAQFLHRLLALCVYPLKLLASHPLPPGFRPLVTVKRAKGLLYPDEDAQLLACTDVPLAHRVLYGLLAREGLRKGEALSLVVRDIDRRKGILSLDANKTNDPRHWMLRADVHRALGWWIDNYVSSGVLFQVEAEHLAAALRSHLKLARVDRDQLYRDDEHRRHIVAHDLRATFVTLALANGKPEAWVCDRTGHRSSSELANYRRAARSFAELNVGDLGPMDRLIPEIAAAQSSAAPRRNVRKSRAMVDSNHRPLASEANALSS